MNKPDKYQSSSEDGLKAFMTLRQEAKQNTTLDKINEEIRKARYGEDK